MLAVPVLSAPVSGSLLKPYVPGALIGIVAPAGQQQRLEIRAFMERPHGTPLHPLVGLLARDAPPGELVRMSARATADVQGTHPASHAGELDELLREWLGVAAHEPGVGVGGDVEGHESDSRPMSPR